MRQAVLLVLLILCAGNAWAYDFSGASKRYGIPRELLEAISKVESGHNSLAVNRNRNGSVDLGHMQVNSDWQKSGKIEWKKLTDAEYCSYVGAWILAQELERYQGNVWSAVAAYNTGKSVKDWEKIAETTEGERRARALILADKARRYSRAVYAAYVSIISKRGERPREVWILETKDQGREQNPAVSSPRKNNVAPMAVMNPYGTHYKREGVF